MIHVDCSDNGHREYKGGKIILMSEITMLMRDLMDEEVFDSEDFELMLDTAKMSEDEIQGRIDEMTKNNPIAKLFSELMDDPEFAEMFETALTEGVGED